MPVTDKAACYLLTDEGKPIEEFIERTTLRPSSHSITTYIGPQPLGKKFKIVAKNLGCRPTLRNPVNSYKSSETVTHNLCLLIFVDEELVYARIISRIGEGRELDGQRKAGGQVEPFVFGVGKGSSVEGKNASGSIRMEIWNAEVIKKLSGVVPIWPGQESGSRTPSNLACSRDVERDEGDSRARIEDDVIVVRETPRKKTTHGSASAVVCRRVGRAPIIIHTIVYGTLPAGLQLEPLREGVAMIPSLHPNFVCMASSPFLPASVPHIPAAPLSPPRDSEHQCQYTDRNLTRLDSPPTYPPACTNCHSAALLCKSLLEQVSQLQKELHELKRKRDEEATTESELQITEIKRARTHQYRRTPPPDRRRRMMKAS